MKNLFLGLARVDMTWDGPRREVLDEIAFATQDCLSHSEIPFCAFNSGKDVYDNNEVFCVFFFKFLNVVGLI